MEATMKNLVDALEDAARTYAEEQRARRSSKRGSNRSRGPASRSREEYKAEGASSEEIDEVLEKTGSLAMSSTAGSEPPKARSAGQKEERNWPAPLVLSKPKPWIGNPTDPL